MEKQLCINRLELPDELLSLIKDFAFWDIVSYTAFARKKIIHTLIHYTRWTYRTKQYDRYMFWIEEDPGCSQYQMVFCDTCGNYSQNHTQNVTEKIYCTCHN